MDRTILLACALSLPLFALARETVQLDLGWEFTRDGESFRPVRVPHDWAVESDFDLEKYDGENGALPWKGVGTYRRTLVLDRRPAGRRYRLDFDGVLATSVCRVNGEVAGRGDYGYLGFSADLTPYLFKGTNVVTVTADTTTLRSRWYPGAGLFRPVRLVTTDDIALSETALAVTTPVVTEARAEVSVHGTVVDRRGAATPLTLAARLLSPKGTPVATAERTLTSAPWDETPFSLSLEVLKPERWELVDPAPLYALELTLSGEGVDDRLVTRVGLRDFRFDPNGGFVLNGRRVQLNGVNLHADLGILGAAFEKSAARRQLAAMREIGANAVRTSHNPPAPEFLDLCDEMGFFVWNEAFDKWDSTSARAAETLEDFVIRQLKAFVRRDRNHPSVFVWSIGNEIPVGAGCAPGQEHWMGSPALGTSAERCGRFRRAVLSEDATRPVGIGTCSPHATPRGDYDPLDVVGWNYGGNYRRFRDMRPEKAAIYSESASAVSEYGWYDEHFPTSKVDYAWSVRRVDSYDRNAAAWSDIPDREFFRMEHDRDISGEFVWTGIDYLGEPSPYNSHWKPCAGIPKSELSRSSYFGIYDLTVFPKDRAFLYRSHWRKDVPTVHLVPNRWDFAGRDALPVYVYASSDEAELFLNGKSLGRRRKDRTKTLAGGYYDVTARYRLFWERVPYEPGELACVAYDEKGVVVGRTSVRTPGPAVKLVLAPEARTIPVGEVVFCRVSLADAAGTEICAAKDFVSFVLEGPGEIVSVGNADPRAQRSFKRTDGYPLFEGAAAVCVRRTGGQGMVRLTARCRGLSASCLWK